MLVLGLSPEKTRSKSEWGKLSYLFSSLLSPKQILWTAKERPKTIEKRALKKNPGKWKEEYKDAFVKLNLKAPPIKREKLNHEWEEKPMVYFIFIIVYCCDYIVLLLFLFFCLLLLLYCFIFLFFCYYC